MNTPGERMTHRWWLMTALIALTPAIHACQDEGDSQFCLDGLVCPDGTQCAAIQNICIENDCGNGVVDDGEACDDGNIEDGDGCSANCSVKGVCGDGITNPQEQCDDGSNGVPAESAACNFDCTSAACGDGIVNTAAGEECERSVVADQCDNQCKIVVDCEMN